MPEQQTGRDAAIQLGANALWGECVGDAHEDATRVVDALLIAGWRPPAAGLDGGTVNRVATALWQESDTVAGFDTRAEWYLRFAKVAVRTVFESPEWRRVAKAASDCAMQDHTRRLASPPTPVVSREQLRTAAGALFRWNVEWPAEPRFVIHRVAEGVDREPYEALLDQVLDLLGIPVQEGGPE